MMEKKALKAMKTATSDDQVIHVRKIFKRKIKCTGSRQIYMLGHFCFYDEYAIECVIGFYDR